MRKLVLLLVMLSFFLLLSSVKGYPYQCSINDPSNDTVNIYTGAPALECPGYVDVISVDIVEDANYLTVKITVETNIPRSSEISIYYYFLLDRDNNPKNNCNDPPFNLCDTFYTVRIKNTVTVSKSVWKSWGWSDASTNAVYTFVSPNTISLRIPKREIGLNSNPRELPWRVVTELEYMCGDLAPNEGVAILRRYFYEEEKNVIVTIPIEVPAIYIDGVEYKPTNGKVEISLAPGEYEFYVPKEISISEYVKLVFVEWSDGVKDNRRKVQVTEEGFNVTCIYEKYFHVKVYSPLGTTIPKEGWYPEDTHIWVGLKENLINISKDIGFVFVEWTGAWGLNSFNPEKHLQEIILKDHIHINATWFKTYLITVLSRYDEPIGGGWYLENSTAKISVKTQLIFNNGTKVVFKKWGGEISVKDANFTLTVDKPYTFVAEWDRFFQVNFHFYTPDREEVSPEFISILDKAGGKYQLTTYVNIWLKEGIYELKEVVYRGVDVKPIAKTIFPVDGPKTFSIECRIYDISIKIFDIFGFPVPGISASTVLPDGEVVKVSGNGLMEIENLPCGTYTLRVNILFFYTKTMSIELYSDREIVLTIPISAILIALFLGIVGGSYYYSKKRCVREKIAFKFLGDELLKELSNIPDLYERLEELDRRYGEVFQKYLDIKAEKKVLEEQLSKARKYRDESISFYENAAKRAEEMGRYMSAYYAEKALQYMVKRFDKIISGLDSQLKMVEKELAEIESRMNNINAQRKAIIDELLMKIDRAKDLLKKIYGINPVCIDCKSIQKLYNDIDDALLKIMEEIGRLKAKIKSGKAELNRLKNRLKDINDEIERAKDEIEKSRRIVERVFSDMIGGEATDYIEICGVRINLTGRIEEFFDRYDAFRRELGKAIRNYWKNKRLLGKLYAERIATQNKIEAFQKYLDDLKSDLNRLKASAKNIEEILDSIDERYKRCRVKLNRCKEKVKKRLEEERDELKKLIRELDGLRNEEIYNFREDCGKLQNSIKGLKRSLRGLEDRVRRFKSEPGYPKRFLELDIVRKFMNKLDDILNKIDEVEDMVSEYEGKAKEIMDLIEETRERIGEAIGSISNLLGKIDEYINEVERVENEEECKGVWEKYVGEKSKILGEIDSIKSEIRNIAEEMKGLEENVRSIKDMLEQLNKMFEGIEKGIKKVIAEVRLKEILKDEDIKRLAKDKKIMRLLKKLLDVSAETAGEVKIIKASAELDIDVEKEIAEELIKGIKDIVGEITGLPIPDTPEEIANEVKDTIRLFGKAGKETDYLRKLSTILSKLPSNPLTPFIRMYSRLIKAFAAALDFLADKIWKLGVEEMKVAREITEGSKEWLTDDELLKKDMEEIYRELEEEVREYITRMRLAESFEGRVRRLVRGMIIKRLAKIIQDP